MKNHLHHTVNNQFNGSSHNAAVIILHGIARSSKHMKPLATYLEHAGFQVFNMDYPSTHLTLHEIADLLCEQCNDIVPDDLPVHFVGYSMGGLLLRIILHRYRPPLLGRVVQLAPPNKGSEVADFFQHFWLYKRIFGLAGQQLITDQHAITSLFGKVDYELGIIAGNRSLDPISSAIIGEANDGKVSVNSTRLDGMKDHIIIPATHTFFPSHRLVHKQIAYFLNHGIFDHSCQ